MISLEAIPLQEGGLQGGRLHLAHRRQLRLVADKHQPAIAATIDEAHQVVEQPTAAKGRLACVHVGNHRRLVDDEKGVAMKVVVEVEPRHLTGERFLTVNLPMDGERRMAAVEGEHLGRPPRGSEKHHLLLQGQHGPDDGSCHSGLARTGRTAHHHHGVALRVGGEA